MFTGIIETMATVAGLRRDQNNLHITLTSPLAAELKIDQSLSHNGVCLTVVECNNNLYTVTAIEETLKKSNLADLQPGSFVNLERCLAMGGRLDGHLVQGHVDATARLLRKEDQNGSYLLYFSFDKTHAKYIVTKGSICINGISLTIVEAEEDNFSVAIIPYTWQHTNLQYLKDGDAVNVEFDVIGKYVERMMLYGNSSDTNNGK